MVSAANASGEALAAVAAAMALMNVLRVIFICLLRVMSGNETRLLPVAAGVRAPPSLPWVVRRNVGVHVHPDTFDLRVLAHGVKPHFAPVAGHADTAKGRAGIHPLVAVDPHHAASHLTCELVGALQVVGP